MEASARQSFNSLHQHHCLDSAALSYLYATAVLQACPDKPTTVTSIPSSKPNLSPCSPLAKQTNPLPYPTFTLPTYHTIPSPLVYRKPLACNQISMISYCKQSPYYLKGQASFLTSLPYDYVSTQCWAGQSSVEHVNGL